MNDRQFGSHLLLTGINSNKRACKKLTALCLQNHPDFGWRRFSEESVGPAVMRLVTERSRRLGSRRSEVLVAGR